MASINDRLSLVFGSLNTSLKPVNDPPLKEEPTIERSITDKTHHKSKPHSRNEPTRSRDRSPRRGQPRQPDYLKRPDKWTRYDLDSEDSQHLEYRGLNDEQVNRKAALDLIHKLRQNKTTPTTHKEPCIDSSDKIVFKKPVIKSRKHTNHPTTTSNEGGHYEGTVHKMPEYFVGLTPSQKPKQLKSDSIDINSSKDIISNKRKCQTIQLSHLEDDEENDDL